MIRDRILQLIQEEGLSSAEFASRIGIQRSSVSHVLSGRNKPSYDFIEKLLRAFPDINANWLISGKGEIYKTPASHQSLFGSSPPGGQSTAPPSEASAQEVNQPAASSSEAIAKEDRQSPAASIRKIMILRDDGTYEEFLPQESGED